MNENQGHLWRQQAEKLLLSLRDVLQVSISLNQDDEVTAIDVLAEGKRQDRQIARDVRSALKAEYRLEIDYDRIQVVHREVGVEETLDSEQIPSQNEALLSVGNDRIAFDEVTVNASKLAAVVRVRLLLADRAAQGEALGSSSKREIPRLVARATLDAMARFLQQETRLELMDLETMRFAGEDMVLVGVRFLQGREEKSLTGSCVVERDLHQSVVYATLHALNRVFGRLEFREPVEFELHASAVS